MPLVPGVVAELGFELFATSVRIRAGHRLRLALAPGERKPVSLAAYGELLRDPDSRWFMFFAIALLSWPVIRNYVDPWRRETFALRPLLMAALTADPSLLRSRLRASFDAVDGSEVPMRRTIGGLAISSFSHPMIPYRRVIA